MPTTQNDGLGGLEQAKKAKILRAGNSNRTIANAMAEFSSVNRTLALKPSSERLQTNFSLFLKREYIGLFRLNCPQSLNPNSLFHAL